MNELTIHEGLSLVKVDGYKADHEFRMMDPIGSANWLCESYGMNGDEYSGPGILEADYDGWRGGAHDFTLLIASDEAQALAEFARANGYHVETVEPITEPTNFGDSHDGTVEILKHREGWVIIDN